MAIEAKIDRFRKRLAHKVAARMPDRCIYQAPSDSQESSSLGFADETLADPGDEIFCRCDGQLRGRNVEVEGRQRWMRLYTVALVAQNKDGDAIVIDIGGRLTIRARRPRPERVLLVQDVADRDGVMIEAYGSLVTN